MIQRIVLLKFKDEFATDRVRREAVARTTAAIERVPNVSSVSVGVPADDRTTRQWDLAISVHFSSLADVQPYIEHPEHRDLVDNYLAPMAEVRKYWNFERAD